MTIDEPPEIDFLVSFSSACRMYLIRGYLHNTHIHTDTQFDHDRIQQRKSLLVAIAVHACACNTIIHTHLLSVL